MSFKLDCSVPIVKVTIELKSRKKLEIHAKFQKYNKCLYQPKKIADIRKRYYDQI